MVQYSPYSDMVLLSLSIMQQGCDRCPQAPSLPTTHITVMPNLLHSLEPPHSRSKKDSSPWPSSQMDTPQPASAASCTRAAMLAGVGYQTW